MSFNRWMVKQTEVYPYQGILLSNERSELLIHATTWMDLKDITLSGKNSVLKRTNTIWFYWHNIPQMTKWWRCAMAWLLPWVSGGGGEGYGFSYKRIALGKHLWWWNSSEIDFRHGYTNTHIVPTSVIMLILLLYYVRCGEGSFQQAQQHFS